MGKNAQTTTGRNTGLAEIKDAIVQAHNLNNRAAISAADITDLGLTSQAFDQWCAYVEELRLVVNDYIDESLRKDSTDAKVQNAAGRVYAEWKDVLSASLGEKYDKAWFIRKSDTAWLLRCGAKDVNTAFGAQYGHHDKTIFRRNVERLIGCRLASNEVLNDKDSDTILQYEGAVAREKTMKERLNGYLKKGEAVEGLIQKAERLEASYEKRKADYAQFIPADKLDAVLAGYYETVKNAKEDVKRAQKSLEDAQNKQEELKERYDEIMATINKIEL